MTELLMRQNKMSKELEKNKSFLQAITIALQELMNDDTVPFSFDNNKIKAKMIGDENNLIHYLIVQKNDKFNIACERQIRIEDLRGEEQKEWNDDDYLRDLFSYKIQNLNSSKNDEYDPYNYFAIFDKKKIEYNEEEFEDLDEIMLKVESGEADPSVFMAAINKMKEIFGNGSLASVMNKNPIFVHQFIL